MENYEEKLPENPSASPYTKDELQSLGLSDEDIQNILDADAVSETILTQYPKDPEETEELFNKVPDTGDLDDDLAEFINLFNDPKNKDDLQKLVALFEIDVKPEEEPVVEQPKIEKFSGIEEIQHAKSEEAWKDILASIEKNAD